jgi:hypothetical protein
MIEQHYALYIIAGQGQASLPESVEVLQTIINIMLLMQHQQIFFETFYLFYFGYEPQF